MTRMLEGSAKTGQTNSRGPATAVEFSHPETQSPTVTDSERIVPSTTPFLA
jgi:hypothetical protein